MIRTCSALSATAQAKEAWGDTGDLSAAAGSDGASEFSFEVGGHAAGYRDEGVGTREFDEFLVVRRSEGPRGRHFKRVSQYAYRGCQTGCAGHCQCNEGGPRIAGFGITPGEQRTLAGNPDWRAGRSTGDKRQKKTGWFHLR